MLSRFLIFLLKNVIMCKSSIKDLRICKNSVCLGIILLLTMPTLLLNSCKNSDQQKNASSIVINEIMAANHTGLLAQDGELYDWFEIKNISTEAVNLKDFAVHVEKSDSAKAKKKAKKKAEDDNSDSSKKEKKEKKSTWQFPDIEIQPGECLVVFASKNDTVLTVGDKKELHSSFKVPSLGGSLQLMLGNEVVSEVKFGELEDDQCYRRLDDGKYEVSYVQTPGFDNNNEGFEKYNTLIEKQRNDPLKMWELHSKGHKEGKAWVEVKNVSGQALNLQDYCLTTSNKDLCQWSFPDVELQPGEVFVVNSKKEEFKIGKTKSVALTKGEKFVDGICACPAPMGTSVGRVEGKDGFFFFPTPTSGGENTNEHYRFIADQPTFATAPGVQGEKKN